MTSDEEFEGPSLDDNDSGAEEPLDSPPQQMLSAEVVTAPEDDPSTPWNRRTFFKSAALGTAAAAMYTGGQMALRPADARYANDLSNLPCTANDVQIIGTGIVVNEPCDCTGTFDAEVVFRVRNITSTGRYCVSVHLTDGRDILLFAPDGTSTAFGKAQGEDFRDTLMTGVLENFPCGAGEVCFGQAGVTRGKCDPGTCSTVAWSTTPGQANCTSPDLTPPGGQCRHQQICIQGRGNTTLDCDLTTDAIEESCPVECGATTTLRLCTTSVAALGPFTFTLDGQSFGPTADTCHDFVVGPITETTTFTGCVTDDERVREVRFRRADRHRRSRRSIAVAGEEQLQRRAHAHRVGGRRDRLHVHVDGGRPTTLGTGPTLSYGPVLDGVCHTINVSAVCGGCDASAIGEHRAVRGDHRRVHAVADDSVLTSTTCPGGGLPPPGALLCDGYGRDHRRLRSLRRRRR